MRMIFPSFPQVDYIQKKTLLFILTSINQGNLFFFLEKFKVN